MRSIKHIDFVPQNAPYKVSVRKGVGNGNWKDYSTVNFEISLNNKRYYGDHFFSILQWAQERFQHITIIICDTLQRYNIMYERKITENEALEVAHNLGKQWLVQNQSHFLSLNIIPKIYFWDDWLSYKKEFELNQNVLNHLYNTHMYFKNMCDKTFEEIWDRFKKNYKDDSHTKNDIIDHVIKPYFFEETSVTSIFLSKLEGVNAYPGTLHQIWDDFSLGKIKGLLGFKDSLFLSLNLTKNHSYKDGVSENVIKYSVKR